MRTAGAAEPPSPPQRGKSLQALRQRPWATQRTSQAGLRRATSLPNRSRFDHDWSAEGSRGHEPRPTPPDTGRRLRRLGARTSAPGTSREAPPTRAPPLPRQPQAPAAAGKARTWLLPPRPAASGSRFPGAALQTPLDPDAPARSLCPPRSALQVVKASTA